MSDCQRLCLKILMCERVNKGVQTFISESDLRYLIQDAKKSQEVSRGQLMVNFIRKLFRPPDVPSSSDSEEFLEEEELEEEEEDFEEYSEGSDDDELEVQNDNEDIKVPLIVRLIQKAKRKHPRGTYTDHTRTITYLIKHHIWQHLSDSNLGVTEFGLAEMLEVSRSTIHRWIQNLRADPSWLPKKLKDPSKGFVFTPQQESYLADIVLAISESESVPITNKLFRRIATQ